SAGHYRLSSTVVLCGCTHARPPVFRRHYLGHSPRRGVSGAWMDRFAAHHAGRGICFCARQCFMASQTLAYCLGSSGSFPDFAVVDSSLPDQPLLDPSLVALERRIVRMASRSRAVGHPSGSALVSMANLAICAARALALARMALRSAHMASHDVRVVAPRHYGVPARRL